MEPLFLQIKHLLGSTDVDDVVAVADVDVEVVDASVVVVDNLMDFRFALVGATVL